MGRKIVFVFVFVLSLFLTRAMTINEVMPVPSSGGDWIEFYNNNSFAVNLSDWKINDSTGELPYYPTGILNSGEFFVLSVGNRLNNNGDSLFLFDNFGNLVDSFSYGYNPGIDKSIGRYPDGSLNVVNLSIPTRGYSNIYDNEAPKFSDIIVIPSNASYSPSNFYEFNITWVDNLNIGDVWIEIEGFSKNYSIIKYGDVYSYKVVGLDAGTYYYKWYANDSVGNINKTSRLNYTINKASQTAQLSVNEQSPIIYGTNINISCNGELFDNNKNITNLIGKSLILSGGQHNLSCRLYENKNYFYDDDNITFFVEKADGEISLLLNGFNNNLSLVYGDYLNASAFSSCGDLKIYRNGIDVTTENNKNIILGAGYYNYSAFFFGNENYSAKNLTRFVNITKATPLLKLILSNDNVTYPEKIFVNGSNCPSQLDCKLYRNGFLINNLINESFSGGVHYFVYNTTGNENYSSGSSEVVRLIVNKGIPMFNYYINSQKSNITLTYPQKVNASAFSNGGIFNIYRNGINVNNENGKNILLGAGNYVYKFNITGNENWTDLEGGIINVGIERAKSQCLIALNSNNLTYGSALILSVYCNNPESKLKLYRNGIDVTTENNKAVVLGAGSYSYKVNVSETQNYTGAENSTNIIVSKASGLVYGYLNGIRGNITIYEYDRVLFDGIVSYGRGVIRIYKDGVLFSSGINEVHNYSLFENSGLYNITFVYEGDENFTSDSETWFVNVLKDDIAPVVNIFHPKGEGYYNSLNLDLDYEADDRHLDKCWYSLDKGIRNSTEVDCNICFVNLNASEGNNSWRVYARDKSGNIGFDEVSFIVDVTKPIVVLDFPVNGSLYSNTNNRVFVSFRTNEDGQCYYVVDNNIRNDGLNTYDNRSYDVSAIIANGEHYVFAYCYDLAGNVGVSENVSIFVRMPSSSVNYYVASGGGGSKSDEMGADYAFSEENIKMGRKALLRENDKIKFVLNGEKHYLILDDIDGNKIKIRILSRTINLEMSLGEVKNVDIENDGKEDIIVKFDGISNNMVEIYIQKVNENNFVEIIREENNLIRVEKENLEEKRENKESGLVVYLAIVIAVLVVLIIFIVGKLLKEKLS